MASDRLLLDTFYALALLNSKDEYHSQAQALLPRVMNAEVWVTEATLTEIGNGLAKLNRQKAAAFIANCYKASNMVVVSVDRELFQAGLGVYQTRDDKAWGLTDCISFVVMERNGLNRVLTGDHHFEQAGYQLLFKAIS